jgi:hypothetical protein
LGILQEIGGVVSVIKDDYYGEEKYVLVFCSRRKLQEFRIKCGKHWGEGLVTEAKMPVRVCRMEKNFSVN